MLQATILEPITRRLLREAGLKSGMRVIDLGCGAGDVSMLVAEMVGPSGEVLAIDRSAEALAVARCSVSARGYTNVRFVEGNAEDFDNQELFDMAVGRYVLIHQADSAAFIRTAVTRVRPGGAIAFHEVAIYDEARMFSSIPLYQSWLSWITAAFKSVLKHPDAARQMPMLFQEAGCNRPTIFCEAIVAGAPDSLLYPWIALTLQNLLPQVFKIGAATAAEVEIETLESRLRIAAGGAGDILSPLQYCCWLRLRYYEVRMPLIKDRAKVRDSPLYPAISRPSRNSICCRRPERKGQKILERTTKYRLPA
jgi:ubiquinone/menaquinone biosynthesis C-methylase UbiE